MYIHAGVNQSPYINYSHMRTSALGACDAHAFYMDHEWWIKVSKEEFLCAEVLND